MKIHCGPKNRDTWKSLVFPSKIIILIPSFTEHTQNCGKNGFFSENSMFWQKYDNFTGKNKIFWPAMYIKTIGLFSNKNQLINEWNTYLVFKLFNYSKKNLYNIIKLKRNCWSTKNFFDAPNTRDTTSVVGFLFCLLE